jgi:hypothetical protein
MKYDSYDTLKRRILREGPSPRGAPSVPPFSPSFSEKRLELKSLKGWTKAEDEGLRGPFLLSFRSPLKAFLVRAVSQEKLGENLQLKPPYKFKNSYGGTPEPQTA